LFGLTSPGPGTNITRYEISSYITNQQSVSGKKPSDNNLQRLTKPNTAILKRSNRWAKIACLMDTGSGLARRQGRLIDSSLRSRLYMGQDQSHNGHTPKYQGEAHGGVEQAKPALTLVSQRQSRLNEVAGPKLRFG
jgi:hypothetical protein